MAPGQGMGRVPPRDGPVTSACRRARAERIATTRPLHAASVGDSATGRPVPPDPIAHDYLLLAPPARPACPGLVDGYFGPAELKARADIEELRRAEPARRRTPGTSSRGSPPTIPRARPARLADRPGRRPSARRPRRSPARTCPTWRRRRAASPGRRSGATRRCSRPRPPRSRGSSRAPEPLADRLGAWDDRFTIPPTGSRTSWSGWWRDSATARRRLFGLPDGEELRIRITRDQPWTGYNWYDGGRRSRFDLNTDLPTRAAELSMSPPTRPTRATTSSMSRRRPSSSTGSHRLETSVLLINTPECLVSEGLADLGHGSRHRPRSGPTCSSSSTTGPASRSRPTRRRPARAADTVALAAPRRSIAESRVNAALLRHADGGPTTRCSPASSGSAGYTRPSPQAARVHRAPAVADLRLRLPRRRGAAPPLARGSSPRRTGPPGSAACCASS